MADRETTNRLLRDFLYVPLIDDEHRIVGVARDRRRGEGISIGSRTISLEEPAFIIAEIGNNHNGKVDLAFDLIRAAAAAGADCAKFQMRNMQTLYGDQALGRSEDLGTEYVLDLLSRFQLTDEELFRCFDLTAQLGMVPLCTAWDCESADRCTSYGLEAFKVASADLTNHGLIRHLSDTRRPMICSTGMSTEAEIRETVDLLQACGAQYILLHCNSAYPAPFRDINLRYMARLSELGGGIVGYSGHEHDIFVSVSAVALGARVIEKHFTFDREMEGNDHKVSLLPDEFRRMIEGIRQVEEALGSDRSRDLTQGERTNRISMAKSVFALRDIESGQVIEPSMLTIRSPGQGLQPNRMNQLLGQTAQRRIAANTPFYPSDLLPTEEESAEWRHSFSHPWGIPVRHRDAGKLIELFKPDFVEFHLSYHDLNIDDDSALTQQHTCGLVVHAPELFQGDHTLDLASPDPVYRQRSLGEMRRVIEKAKNLARYFDVCGPIGIICNVGGFSATRFLTSTERQEREALLAHSISKLKDPLVALWPQTMPPYPWHFGGQRFHNLFVSPEDIVRLCTALSLKVCLDTSHSRLACNEYSWSFDDFLTATLPHTAHLHIADAHGVSGEGLQIGEGDINFRTVFRTLARLAPGASFIPEVWQGHENHGEGFSLALRRLAIFAKRF
jgi:N-acetylneuraminate synthase